MVDDVVDEKICYQKFGEVKVPPRAGAAAVIVGTAYSCTFNF
jgi:hypothetical protein